MRAVPMANPLPAVLSLSWLEAPAESFASPVGRGESWSLRPQGCSDAVTLRLTGGEGGERLRKARRGAAMVFTTPPCRRPSARLHRVASGKVARGRFVSQHRAHTYLCQE